MCIRDRSTGLFVMGDQIKGMTSGALFQSIGVNSGLKWLFAGPVTGTFQADEYITNSTLTFTNCTQSVIVKKAELSGSKSVFIPTNGALSSPASNNYAFGTGDFTIQGWFRPATNTTLQTLFDFRRLSAAQGLRIVQDVQAIKVYNGTTQMLTSGNVVTTTGTWMHIAVSRASGITQLYINGAQVGGNAADTNDYLYAALYVGQDFNGSTNWSGHVDNVCIKKGVGDYTTGFTAPTQVDYSELNIVFGLDGEAPFILSTEEVYAKYSGQRSSATTSKRIDYSGLAIIAEDVDLGRQEYRDCADIIDLNGAYIAEEAVGRMKAAFSDFTIRGDVPAQNSYGGTDTCIRDTKDYILGALIKDLREGGNYHTIYTARTYLTVGGKLDFIGEEVLQSLYTWNEVIKLAKEIITTTSTTLTGTYTTRYRIPNNLSLIHI